MSGAVFFRGLAAGVDLIPGMASGKQIPYLIAAAVLTVVVLIGISMMSRVERAVRGNLLGSLAMALAIGLTLWAFDIFSVIDLWIALLVGSALGFTLSRRVQMIQMPQMVGLLNGFGGAASMIAGALTLINAGGDSPFSLITSGLAIVVGSLTLFGSLIAAGKLHCVLTQKPVVLKNHQFWTMLTLILSLVTVVMFLLPPFADGPAKTILIIASVLLAAAFGVIFAIRVGGADMPITISLLNSFSGVAGGIAGLAISDPLLVAVGGIVGASGLLLTQIMCRAMNRKLLDILLGKTSTPTKTAAPAPAPKAEPVASPLQSEIESVKAPVLDDYIAHLHQAKKVIIVPGYGMALSQAQPLVKQLAECLEDAGKAVDFAIHPVAGRMPGHMNVLLAEVDIPYEKLREMDEINDEFAETDVALVIGANDVVNPAANSAEGTPIYGMPILNVEAARHIIMLNFDTKPGYAGVDNPLYDDAHHGRVSLLLGDAKDSLKKILTGMTTAAVAAADDAPAAAADDVQSLRDADRVIIVPGYGMALSQAQPLVRDLADRLESMGKTVDFAIHPVAGRMPGHMNVLLAEVDVPYDKLREMDDINDEFADADVVIVIGANDVVNPAANSAEGTPIYGMPILDVERAGHVIMMNFDTKPGYAGVDNPLYGDEFKDKVTLRLGDAKETLKALLAAITLPSSLPRREVSEVMTSIADPGDWLTSAKRIIIVPGYGMALSQAQTLVKRLNDELESKGKTVDFAIHPVAGRMPGHMNVLLAEVDIPYDKLREMSDINDEFADADVVIVIGANDVVNPAANTAEGTPIYGMPILDVDRAKKIIILNFDTKPGYAGVDNPLYDESYRDRVFLMLGDAKDSLKQLLEKLG